MAYNSIIIPYGWVLCDGNNGTPNLINRFILGGGVGGGGTRNIGTTGGAERVTLGISDMPDHTHGGPASLYYLHDTRVQSGNWQGVNNTGFVSAYTGNTGNNASHENMPPFRVLIYIMNTRDYDFCYNVVL